MISLAESLILIAVAVGLLGFAVIKSRRVRIVIGIMMAITALRAVAEYAWSLR